MCPFPVRSLDRFALSAWPVINSGHSALLECRNEDVVHLSLPHSQQMHPLLMFSSFLSQSCCSSNLKPFGMTGGESLVLCSFHSSSPSSEGLQGLATLSLPVTGHCPCWAAGLRCSLLLSSCCFFTIVWLSQ